MPNERTPTPAPDNAYSVPENLIAIGGAAAVAELFAQRPHCIHKLWLTQDTRKDFGPLCQYLAANKKSYALMPDRELDKEHGSGEHGGVIAFAHARQSANLSPSRIDQWRKDGDPLLLIPDLDSPQTLGRLIALARSHGLKRVLISRSDCHIAEHGQAYTHAGGALEHVRIFTWEGRLGSLLKPLRERYLLVGMGGSGASRISWGKPLSAPGRPVALIAPDTALGLANEIIPACEYRIQYPGLHPEVLTRAEATAPVFAWLFSKQKNPTAPEHGFRARQREKKQPKG